MKEVIVSSTEHRQLYNKNGYNLAIFPGGFVKYRKQLFLFFQICLICCLSVRGVRDAFSPYSVLRLEPVDVGEVRIRGETTSTSAQLRDLCRCGDLALSLYDGGREGGWCGGGGRGHGLCRESPGALHRLPVPSLGPPGLPPRHQEVRQRQEREEDRVPLGPARHQVPTQSGTPPPTPCQGPGEPPRLEAVRHRGRSGAGSEGRVQPRRPRDISRPTAGHRQTAGGPVWPLHRHGQPGETVRLHGGGDLQPQHHLHRGGHRHRHRHLPQPQVRQLCGNSPLQTLFDVQPGSQGMEDWN